MTRENPSSKSNDAPATQETGPLTRRVVLKRGGAMMFAAWVPAPLLLSGCGGGGSDGSPSTAATQDPAPVPTQAVSFLSRTELETLRAATDRFIPGPPEDPSPGAVDAQCAEAISLFLGAFLTDPPFIYAGGPFSDRSGASGNDFLEFVALDDYKETAWRLLIEGSQGRPELEFNGPVVGAQQIYRDGLAQLDARAGGPGAFAAAPALQRDLILADTSDTVVQAFVDIAYPDTLEAMYGPPEYGGNNNLVGWTSNEFDGDVQPRGYTDEQVINADNPGLLDFLLPASYGRGNNPAASARTATSSSPTMEIAAVSAALPALISSDTVAAAMSAANGSMAAFRSQLAPLVGTGGGSGNA